MTTLSELEERVRSLIALAPEGEERLSEEFEKEIDGIIRGYQEAHNEMMGWNRNSFGRENELVEELVEAMSHSEIDSRKSPRDLAISSLITLQNYSTYLDVKRLAESTARMGDDLSPIRKRTRLGNYSSGSYNLQRDSEDLQESVQEWDCVVPKLVPLSKLVPLCKLIPHFLRCLVV